MAISAGSWSIGSDSRRISNLRLGTRPPRPGHRRRPSRSPACRTGPCATRSRRWVRRSTTRPAEIALDAKAGTGGINAKLPEEADMTLTRRILLAAAASVAAFDQARAEDDPRMAERSIGKPDAKLTVTEYFSLTCTHCAAFQRET